MLAFDNKITCMHNQTVFVLVNVQVYQITNQTNKIERLEELCFFTIESR